ncbi:hypothetical protein BMS3Abin17_00626 [archaeon BMS3Abin17]|nr:hypothetical protein BMS3Abin17_00626 [archaeon BMS3Abin17]HDZ60181.1 hypothetical protein [Candidatus Pacearchaeota archaeon]
MKQTTYKKIEIEWKDITQFPHKITEEDIKNCVIEQVKTIGYLIKEDKKSICIAMSLYKSGEFGDFYIIPKGCIIKKRFIK